MNSKPMLNAYPDSLGRNLGDIVTLLKTEALQNVFSSFYILPSLYHSDLDRGFSVIDYDLNEQLADREGLDQLKNMGIDLKLDFILNHASAQSPQFLHGRQYLGQMDVNIQSPKVWEFYRETLEKIASYGAAIVRLDAFAYAPKAPGKKNFLNDPETWELLQKIHALAEPLGLTLLPEIHAAYDEKIYETLAEKGYATYDFFLPGLVIDAIENRRGTYLAAWAKEIVEKKISTVNMLGCQMLLARAIQMFMPGKPQVWYLDLFAGKNDHEAVRRAGESGHKEINRTNLSTDQITEGLKKDVVQKQLALIRMRNTHKIIIDETSHIGIMLGGLF